MIIEAGKSYMTRNARKTSLVQAVTYGIAKPFSFKVNGDPHSVYYCDENGMNHSHRETAFDLVSEAV